MPTVQEILAAIPSTELWLAKHIVVEGLTKGCWSGQELTEQAKTFYSDKIDDLYAYAEKIGLGICYSVLIRKASDTTAVFALVGHSDTTLKNMIKMMNETPRLRVPEEGIKLMWFFLGRYIQDSLAAGTELPLVFSVRNIPDLQDAEDSLLKHFYCRLIRCGFRVTPVVGEKFDFVFSAI